MIKKIMLTDRQRLVFTYYNVKKLYNHELHLAITFLVQVDSTYLEFTFLYWPFLKYD